MRQLDAEIRIAPGRHIATVTHLDDLSSRYRPDRLFLVPVADRGGIKQVLALNRAGAVNLIPAAREEALLAGSSSSVVFRGEDAELGDVVAIDARRRLVPVVYRRSDRHHTVFLTNRCNSNCLMCSQPPTQTDDSWLIDEAVEIAHAMHNSPEVIGFSGGEPLLVGAGLRKVLDAFLSHHPDAAVEVLTNGRGFADEALANTLLTALSPRVSWMVPLYGHCDFLHDYVVQSPGAFDQTIAGLLELQSHRQTIQIRIVLIRPVLEILPALCDFIGRNLPFAADVALMGCEPTGFALANREACEVDYCDWAEEILAAAQSLSARGLACRIMNIPLCLLKADAEQFTTNSISDWKKVFAPECDDCSARARCTGLFASYERGWKPGLLRPVMRSIA